MEWPVVLSAFLGSALGVLASLATLLVSERVRGRIATAIWVEQEK